MPDELEDLIESLGLGDENDEPEPPAAPAPLTADQIGATVGAAVDAALERRLAQTQPEGEGDGPQYTPEQSVLMALDARDAMLNDVRSMYPNAPDSVYNELREMMSGLTGPQLKQVKEAGNHRMVADHLMAEAARKGELEQPQTRRVVGAEPIGGGGHSFTRGAGPEAPVVDPVIRAELGEITSILQAVNPNFKFTREAVERGLKA